MRNTENSEAAAANVRRLIFVVVVVVKEFQFKFSFCMHKFIVNVFEWKCQSTDSKSEPLVK